MRAELNFLRAKLDEIEKLQKRSLRPTFTDSTEELSQLDYHVSSMNTKLRELKQKLKQFTVPSTNSSEYIRTILHNLERMITEEIQDFSIKFRLSQQMFSAAFARIEAQKNRANPQNADPEITDLLHTNQEERENKQFLDDLRIVNERAAAVRDILVNLADLIAQQGEVVNRIDQNIQNSYEHVKIAHEELEKAHKHRKKSRMWLCAAILAGLIVLLLIVGVCK